MHEQAVSFLSLVDHRIDSLYNLKKINLKNLHKKKTLKHEKAPITNPFLKAHNCSPKQNTSQIRQQNSQVWEKSKVVLQRPPRQQTKSVKRIMQKYVTLIKACSIPKGHFQNFWHSSRDSWSQTRTNFQCRIWNYANLGIISSFFNDALHIHSCFHIRQDFIGKHLQ